MRPAWLSYSVRCEIDHRHAMNMQLEVRLDQIHADPMQICQSAGMESVCLDCSVLVIFGRTCTFADGRRITGACVQSTLLLEGTDVISLASSLLQLGE